MLLAQRGKKVFVEVVELRGERRFLPIRVLVGDRVAPEPLSRAVAQAVQVGSNQRAYIGSAVFACEHLVSFAVKNSDAEAILMPALAEYQPRYFPVRVQVVV